MPLRVSTFSGTDLVVDGSLNTKVTSATHNFVAADVGTRLQITAGTGWTTGFYVINSVAANAATLASSPAAVSTTGGSWTEVGVDYANQLAVQVAIGGGVVTTSITTNVISFTGGTYTPSNADVGNHVQMISGTNVTANSFFWVVSVTATTWVMDANVVSAGTTVNAVGNMGGAILTLAKLAANMIASNKGFATGAFTSTATVTFAQTAAVTSTVPYTRLIGYGSVRGDTTHATLTLSTNVGLTGIAATGQGFSVDQMDVDCGSLGTSTGIATGTNGMIQRCKASNFATAGIAPTGSSVVITECEATGGTAAATAGINQANAGLGIFYCSAHDNACPGIRSTSNTQVIGCLSTNNTGASSDGIQLVNTASLILNNTCHGNGRDGIRVSTTNAVNMRIRNNLLTNNTGFGLTLTTGTALPAAFEYDGNVYGGGASANTAGTVAGTSGSAGYSVVGLYGVAPYVPTRDVTLTGSPYVGPTSGSTANFALNNTTGAGAACRSAGAPATFPGNTGTTSYPDMGAVQTRGSSTSPSTGSPGIITAT